jgi:hypothetical protein
VSGSPRDGFRVRTLMVVLLSPGEWLPRCMRGSEVGIDGERTFGLTPCRYGVKWRGRVDYRRVGKNAVEREAAVGAVRHFGGGA